MLEASENLMEELLSYLPDKSGTILDVACGLGATTAYLLKYYAAADVTAINISEEQLDTCRRKLPDVTFQRADAARMDFPQTSFDNIICVEAAFHFFTRESFARRAYDVLKPGGRIVLSDLLNPPRQQPENYVAGLDQYYAIWRHAGFGTVRFHEVKAQMWNAYADYALNRSQAQWRAGEINQRELMTRIRLLQLVEPMATVVGYCEKPA